MFKIYRNTQYSECDLSIDRCAFTDYNVIEINFSESELRCIENGCTNEQEFLKKCIQWKEEKEREANYRNFLEELYRINKDER